MVGLKSGHFGGSRCKMQSVLLPEPRSSLTEEQQLQPRFGGHLRDEEPGQPHDQDVPSTVLI